MSQVAAKKKLHIHDERVKVTAHFLEQGSVLKGTSRGTCEGFEIEMFIESDEPAPEIAELIRLSHQMCFTEDALTGKAKLTTHHHLNGKPFDLESAAP